MILFHTGEGEGQREHTPFLISHGFPRLHLSQQLRRPSETARVGEWGNTTTLLGRERLVHPLRSYSVQAKRATRVQYSLYPPPQRRYRSFARPHQALEESARTLVGHELANDGHPALRRIERAILDSRLDHVERGGDRDAVPSPKKKEKKKTCTKKPKWSDKYHHQERS